MSGIVPAASAGLRETFRAMFAELAAIGRDPVTGGLNRFAWTAEDRAARDWFTAEAGSRGLDVYTDRNGTLWAWWGEPADGAVVTGSHLDSVPDGGLYDGPLGVISAFCAVDLLRAGDFVPARPVAVTAFADEEGARFGVACAGSRLTTGGLSPERARGLTDSAGISMRAALAGSGLDPDGIGADPAALARIGVFVEVHVEQGRALVDQGHAVAVARGIWPHGRWSLTFRGAADHAGAARMEDRRDPALAAAFTILAANKKAREIGGPAGTARATVGRATFVPGAANGVPSSVTISLDARAADEPTLTRLVEAVTAAASDRAGRDGVSMQIEQHSRTPATGFDPALAARLAAALGAADCDASPAPLPTAAGHDAGVLADAGVPAAMLFVRNPTGVSHSPAEGATEDDCLAGVHALAVCLAELAG